MRSWFRQGREAEIIVYFPDATKTASHFTAKITIHTQLEELRQMVREFFQLGQKDCHIAFKDRNGLEVYVNEVNFERIKDNIHVEKLFKVIEYDPNQAMIFSDQMKDEQEEIQVQRPLSRLKGIARIEKIRNDEEVHMNFIGYKFRQIVPALVSLGLSTKKEDPNHRYYNLSQQLITLTKPSIDSALASFFVRPTIEIHKDK